MKRIYSISTVQTFVCATSALAVDKAAVLDTYANIAAAKYQDSLVTAQTLQAAVNTLVTTPSAEALQNAKEAWLAARIPYQQTEVYRFGNPIVDDWEGKVNAWPLDEGLIDYVSNKRLQHHISPIALPKPERGLSKSNAKKAISPDNMTISCMAKAHILYG